MQEEAEQEYSELKDFFLFFAERYFNVEGVPPESRPVARLGLLETKSMKTALKGLRQAIGDCVEMSSHFDHAEVQKLDTDLRSRDIVTLSELRRRHSKHYARIMRRGQIKNDTEFYLARNVLNDATEKSSEELELLERITSEYEGA